MGERPRAGGSNGQALGRPVAFRPPVCTQRQSRRGKRPGLRPAPAIARCAPAQVATRVGLTGRQPVGFLLVQAAPTDGRSGEQKSIRVDDVTPHRGARVCVVRA